MASHEPFATQIGSSATPLKPGSSFNPQLHSSSTPALQRSPSPDASSIFERDVQESTHSGEADPAIPSHIKTDDLIPPALEASSLVLTDTHLRPEEVEIVTHTAHQPAAAGIAETVASAPQSESHLPHSADNPPDGFIPATLHRQSSDDTASNYASLDPHDMRRLSFISFADVVQGEHAESSSSVHHAPHATRSPGMDRSPSPKRPRVPPSHLSPLGMTSDTPTTASENRKLNVSPPCSDVGNASHQHGELSIETMSQALRKTASGDMSVVRSHRTSPTIGNEERWSMNAFR